MQIGLHELKQQVHVFIVVCADGIDQFDDVGMIKLFQDFYFPVGTLGVCGMLECIEYLLQRQNSLRRLLLNLPHVTVCPRAHLLEDVETAQDV